MAIITKITNSEKIVAANHPLGFDDTKNRCIQELYTAFVVEHDSTGNHTQKSNAIVGEIGSYVGTGTAHTETFSNVNITPKILIIWYDTALAPMNRLDIMTGDHSFRRISAGSWFAGAITSMTTGSFDVGGDTGGANANGITHYYLALGIDTNSTFTGDVGAGSDPTWLEDGDSLYGDGTGSSPANQVESAIETNFEHEHNIDGTHSTDPYTGFAKVETGTYTGDGNDDRDISLDLSDLDIKYLIILKYDVNLAYTRSEDMTSDNTKKEGTAAFQSNQIQSISTTGQFQVGTDINTSSSVYYYLAIGE